jgi:hypothetical protein
MSFNISLNEVSVSFSISFNQVNVSLNVSLNQVSVMSNDQAKLTRRLCHANILELGNLVMPIIS